METIKGIITKKEIEEGLSKKNGKPYTRTIFTLNDKSYSTFDDTISATFKVGDNVAMQGEQVGQYWNMKSMGCIEDEPAEESVEIEHISRSEDIVVSLLRQILAELKNK